MRPARLLSAPRWILLAVVVGLAIAATGVAYGTIPDSSGVIHACYNPNGATGTNGAELRIIDDEQASCSKGARKVTWNEAGAPGDDGDDGADGVSGYELVNAGFPQPNVGSFSVGADKDCPTGKKPLGGGVSGNWGPAGAVFRGIDMRTSFPTATGGWSIVIGKADGTEWADGDVLEARLWVVCITAN